MVQTLVSLRSVIVKWWWATRNRIADDTVHTTQQLWLFRKRGITNYAGVLNQRFLQQLTDFPPCAPPGVVGGITITGWPSPLGSSSFGESLICFCETMR